MVLGGLADVVISAAHSAAAARFCTGELDKRPGHSAPGDGHSHGVSRTFPRFAARSARKLASVSARSNGSTVARIIGGTPSAAPVSAADGASSSELFLTSLGVMDVTPITCGLSSRWRPDVTPSARRGANLSRMNSRAAGGISKTVGRRSARMYSRHTLIAAHQKPERLKCIEISLCLPL
jgi:hypothetical protein